MRDNFGKEIEFEMSEHNPNVYVGPKSYLYNSEWFV